MQNIRALLKLRGCSSIVLQARMSQVWFPMWCLRLLSEVSTSTSDLPLGGGGKGGRGVGLITLPPSCVDCLRILGASTAWRPRDSIWACSGFAFIFTNLRPEWLVVFEPMKGAEFEQRWSQFVALSQEGFPNKACILRRGWNDGLPYLLCHLAQPGRQSCQL